MRISRISLACLALAALAAPTALAQEKPRLAPRDSQRPQQPAVEQPIEVKKAGRPAPKPVLPAGVLVDGDPPLTEATVVEIADALGRVTGSPLNVSETQRLRLRMVEQWQRGGGFVESIVATRDRLRSAREHVESFPAAARPNAWKQTETLLLKEAKASPDSYLSEVLLRAESVAHEQLVIGDPPLSKAAAQSFFEMRDFVNGMASGKMKTRSASDVLRGGAEVAEAFAQAPPEDKQFIHGADRGWALARAHLDAMSAADRAALKSRAVVARAQAGAIDLAGTLTPAAVRAFFTDAGLLAPIAGFYWSTEAAK